MTHEYPGKWGKFEPKKGDPEYELWRDFSALLTERGWLGDYATDELEKEALLVFYTILRFDGEQASIPHLGEGSPVIEKENGGGR